MPTFTWLPPQLAGLDFHRGRLFETHDADEAQSRLSQVFSPHTLRVLGTDSGLHAWADHLPLGSLSLNRISWSVPVAVDPGELPDYYLLCIPLAGHIGYRHGREHRHAGPGELAIAGGGERFHFSTSMGYEQLVLRLERQALESAWTALAGVLPAAPICFYNPPSTPARTAEILAPALGLMVAALCGEWNTATLPHLHARLQDLLLTTLLLRHPHSAQLAAPRAGRAGSACLRKAQAFLLDRLEMPVTLAMLAAGVGVPARTLQAAFHTTEGLGPMQWLRARRLEAVRAILLAPDDPPPRITETALRFGFTHLGEFSRHYRHTFGETPRQTLARRL